MKRYPIPTPAVRLICVDNLHVYLERQVMHASNFVPSDGLEWSSNLNTEVQETRHARAVPVGQKGRLTDYLPFYFGARSVMLYQLTTGWVKGYDRGQEPLIHLVIHVRDISTAGTPFVFTDGHALARFTRWFDKLEDLNQIDWEDVERRQWNDIEEDNDRQRRKQAEFLVYKQCPWKFVRKIVVYNKAAKDQVKRILVRYSKELHRIVSVNRQWYY